MPDELTDEEMLLILDYIEEHGVTKCPPATFTKDAAETTPLREQTFRFGGKGRKRDPRVQERRRRVLDLADGERTAKEIAAILDVSVAVIQNDAQRLRKSGHDVPLPWKLKP